MKRKAENMTIHTVCGRLLPLLFVAAGVLAGCVRAAEPAAAVDGRTEFDRLTFDRAACPVLENGTVRLVVDPLHGGRIIEYSREGKNIIYDADPGHPDRVFPFADHYMGPAGGRFDIGPEDTVPEHLELWQGAWKVERATPRTLRLLSAEDRTLGLQLEREFTLSEFDSSVTCKQTIRNISAETKTSSHWFRTFARGGGICVFPLTPGSRFPLHYLSFDSWPLFQVRTRPKEKGVAERDGFLLVDGTAGQGKIGLDSYAGWFAYYHPSNLLMVKQFQVYPDRRYADITGLTAAIYFNPSLAELESLGPEERLAPGQTASYSETWWLLPAVWPGTSAAVDLKQLQSLVNPLIRKP